MSIAKLSMGVKSLGRVIVRGFEGRPAILQARRVGAAIQVYRDKPASFIGYSPKLVYQFNEGLFRELDRAYAEGRCKELERGWEKAVRVS